MGALHNARLISSYEIINIEDVKIWVKANEHGCMYLKCLIDEKYKCTYTEESTEMKEITLIEESDDEDTEILFNGYINTVRISRESGSYYLEIIALSRSILLDTKKKSRSFQNTEMTYNQVMERIVGEYGEGLYTPSSAGNVPIGSPIFQNETDYELIKRIGSLIGVEIISEIKCGNNIISFGRIKNRKVDIDEGIDYSVGKDLIQVYKNTEVPHTSYFFYTINSKKILEMGDKVHFKDKNFMVYEYELNADQGELIYTYKLCMENSVWQEPIFNYELIGTSLEGTITAVDGENVKIQLDIDNGKYADELKWFRYAPPTGNIMYSMPIVGTRALLYFQNCTSEPIVTGCVRENGESCEKFANTDNRYFTTEAGNELDMLPDSVNIVRGGLSVSLNDGSGVNISSPGDLTLKAEDKLAIEGKEITIKGEEKIDFKANGGNIKLEKTIDISGDEVKDNGSDRQAFEPFGDDPRNIGPKVDSDTNLEVYEKGKLYKERKDMVYISSTGEKMTGHVEPNSLKFCPDDEEKFKDMQHKEEMNAIGIVNSFIPITGDIADAYAAISGEDFFTGEKLGTGDRIITGVSAVIPFLGVGWARKAAKKAADLF